jgi:hypothetical protein
MREGEWHHGWDRNLIEKESVRKLGIEVDKMKYKNRLAKTASYRQFLRGEWWSQVHIPFRE